jgi:hypothetical protein
MARKATGAVVAAILLAVPVAASARARTYTIVFNPFTQYSTSDVRPSSFALAQDGSIDAEHLHWKGWNTAKAVGTGTGLYRLWPAYKFKTAKATVTLTDIGTHSCVTASGDFTQRVYMRAQAVVGPRVVRLKLTSPGC